MAQMKSKGWIYYQGNGVTQDYTKALAIFQQDAAKGDVDSMAIIGAMYHDGEGVEVDYSKALQWFTCAAEKGHAPSMAMLGVMYQFGRGVKMNYDLTKFWYTKAAVAGIRSAKEWLEMDAVIDFKRIMSSQ